MGVVGIESASVASTIRQDLPVTDGTPGSDHDARGSSRTRPVARLATALADAVLAGDREWARALAEELRAVQARAMSRGLLNLVTVLMISSWPSLVMQTLVAGS